MTKRTYKQAKARMDKQNSASDWSLKDCQIVDQYIKQDALKEFNRWLKRNISLSKPIIEYLRLMVRFHYGSAETDDLLRALKCYKVEG